MSLWSLWRREREIRRRLRRMQAGVQECLDDTSRLSAVCRELGIDPETMEQWLRAVRGEPPAPPKLQAERLPDEGVEEEVRGREPFPRTKLADPFADRIRRLIVLVLEHPLARRDPETASDFVVQLANVAAKRDFEGLRQLEGFLGWMTRIALAESIKIGVEIPASGEIGPLAMVSAGSSRRPWSVKMASEDRMLQAFRAYLDADARLARKTERIVALFDISAPVEVYRYLDETGRHPLPEKGDWEPTRAILQTAAGRPQTGIEPAGPRSLDSRATESGESLPQAEANLLVVVRSRLHRLFFTLADASRLLREAVEQAIQELDRFFHEPIPELLWQMDQGPELWRKEHAEKSPPQNVDVAWSQPDRENAGGRPEFSSFPDQQISKVSIHDQPTALEVGDLLDTGVARRSLTATLIRQPKPEEDATARRLLALRQAVSAAESLEDPDLAVRLAGAVCSDRGILHWETCLTLANSRARFHRYVENVEAADWRVQVGVRPGLAGAIEIPFAVVEQPLSARFRERFEAADLEGRVRILWQLVDYASQLHTSLLTLTSDQAERQVALREDELWERLGERRAS